MTEAGTPQALLTGAVAGERRPLARLLTAIENDATGIRELLPDLFAAGRGAHLVGITGPPGSGKSTLVNALTRSGGGAAGGWGSSPWIRARPTPVARSWAIGSG